MNGDGRGRLCGRRRRSRPRRGATARSPRIDLGDGRRRPRTKGAITTSPLSPRRHRGDIALDLGGRAQGDVALNRCLGDLRRPVFFSVGDEAPTKKKLNLPHIQSIPKFGGSENTRNEMEGHNQEGQTLQQEIILVDSTVSNKHKRNKSLEDANKLPKSPKTGGVKVEKVKVSSGALLVDIFCTFIYGKCYRTPRRVLCNELTRISNQNVLWLVGGDFNIISHPNENLGGNVRALGSIDDFNDMVIDTGLIDVGFEGEQITWTNNRVWRRLDRVFHSKEWTEIFNSTKVSHLPEGFQITIHSSLMLLKLRTKGLHPSAFRISG
ncbi:UNVERIFIED_CONTAM: hypothetical protein Sradi_3011200 [Sesamum radiatum]|uniref:Uncharacterized protein n=1 Tax=Sesamum radiatum TaxID=300843 RepID=A0AAW2S181_SESRA